jgi:ABC-2 type transport system permease protein
MGRRSESSSTTTSTNWLRRRLRGRPRSSPRARFCSRSGLVKPVSRAAIVNAKLLAALTMLVATDVLYYAAASIFANLVKTSDFSMTLFFLINATLFFIQLIFLTIGFMVSVLIPKLKSMLPVSLGIVFGFYILDALIVTGKNDWTRFIAPFKYFDIFYIIKNSSYEAPYLITGAIIVIVSIVASYIIYTKKDIHAAS